MGRGSTASVGTTRVAKNGYHYTKVEGRGWVLTHWLTAEKKLGRPIGAEEQVRFVSSKFKTDPYNEDGIVVIQKRKASLRKRKAQLEARIADLKAELDEIDKQIGDTALSEI